MLFMSWQKTRKLVGYKGVVFKLTIVLLLGNGLPHPDEIQFLHLASRITVLESVEK